MSEKISIMNDREETLEVVLEPLARSIELAPGEIAYAFDVLRDHDFPAEMVATKHGIQVWLNFEGYLLHKGEVIPNHPYDTDDVENLRKLKAHMAEKVATRGGWKRGNS